MKSERRGMVANSDLVLIRHAEADHHGRLLGRTDVGLSEQGRSALAGLTVKLPPIADIWVSPAVRCRVTAEALWPEANLTEDARLWEQDFGDWDGRAYGELPDLGPLSRSALAELAAPGGESFADLCVRVKPVLQLAADQARTNGPVAIVAHAGIVRAGLAMALDNVADGLVFEIDPLSATILRCLPGDFAIRRVNEPIR
jgi:alpha-ribazole phosphatase